MKKHAVLAFLVGSGLATSALAQVPGGVDGAWIERGNAGGTGPVVFGLGGGDLTEANITAGDGALTTIEGALTSGEFDADPYVISITNPSSFSASVDFGPSSNGSFLALFDATTLEAVAAVFEGSLSGALVPGAGDYILFVYSQSGESGGVPFGPDFQPANSLGEFLFNYDLTMPGVEIGPASGLFGGLAWDNNAPTFGASSFATVNYTVTLTGAEYAILPAPGTAALAVLAGMAATRRRRT
ncbi:MAG: hypothetical protein AAGI30_01675 [Planctomycetota bacterium]